MEVHADSGAGAGLARDVPQALAALRRYVDGYHSWMKSRPVD